MNAALKTPGAPAPIEVHGILIDPARHEATVDGAALGLTPSEFQILHLLARRSGWVFTRARIVDEIRGAGYPITDRAVDAHIVNLRRKIEPQPAKPRYLVSGRGLGYRFDG